ncbi:MAG: hypothetical protein QF918_09140 [Pirellulaceae bacterium]|nr:hypothetical protein [Pirellulaceae bacterium]
MTWRSVDGSLAGWYDLNEEQIIGRREIAHLALRCSALAYSALGCPVLGYSVLAYSVLAYSALAYSALGYSVLAYLVDRRLPRPARSRQVLRQHMRFGLADFSLEHLAPFRHG